MDRGPCALLMVAAPLIFGRPLHTKLHDERRNLGRQVVWLDGVRFVHDTVSLALTCRLWCDPG